MKLFSVKKLLISFVLTAVVGAVSFYVSLPALSFYSPGFYVWLTFLLAVFFLPFLVVDTKNDRFVYVLGPKSRNPAQKWLAVAVISPVLLMIVFQFVSSTFFNAKNYAGVISVTEAEFSEDMPQTKNVSNIALMDTASAQIIGNRALGSLSEVVSQYTLDQTYTQINYAGHPRKLSNLEYADFFKWLNNRAKGIPGFVMVDPVGNTAEYVKLDTPMFYAESAYFSKDLQRALRFAYPTKIFGNVSFEIDEDGNPFYIVSCMKPKVAVFGAMDVSEVIVFDPCTGDSVLYPVGEVPSWIDIVYDGYLASDKYDWYGTLSGGFWNSIIGNVGCKICTDDFGYIALEDDVWYFTGVTSVNEDSSNIGFILTNARTGEYKYYPVIGAEEYSAMAAAEGEVQEKNYVASFPSLINVSGQPTYIMVLKDNGGLVKLYALVNVTTYSIVATGQTQDEAMDSYVKLLSQYGILKKEEIPEEELIAVETMITEIRLAMLDGKTYVYLNCEDGKVYKRLLDEDEGLMLLKIGDTLTGKCEQSGTEGIYLLTERK